METLEKRKVSKAAVDYRFAKGKHNCGNCVMFHPEGTCDKVAGKIRAQDICSLWESKK